jgi:hypothetical protein
MAGEQGSCEEEEANRSRLINKHLVILLKKTLKKTEEAIRVKKKTEEAIRVKKKEGREGVWDLVWCERVCVI